MWVDWAETLLDGFLGAVVGGAVAALIALRTTKAAISAATAAADRERALQAASKLRELLAKVIAVSATARVDGRSTFIPSELTGLLGDGYVTLKAAQFARVEDLELKSWLTWLHKELERLFRAGPVPQGSIDWMGRQFDVLERRLFEPGAALTPESRS